MALEEGYNLADMSEDEKDELIKELALAYNNAFVTAITLHNGMSILAGRLNDWDVLGQRSTAMRDVAHRMRICAALARNSLGIDEQKLMEDMEFARIVADLQEDEE